MEIRDTEVWGFKNALFGMRNPMDSWDKSDSKYWFPNEFIDEVVCGENIEWAPYHIGENDMRIVLLHQTAVSAFGEVKYHAVLLTDIFHKSDICSAADLLADGVYPFHEIFIGYLQRCCLLPTTARYSAEG